MIITLEATFLQITDIQNCNQKNSAIYLISVALFLMKYTLFSYKFNKKIIIYYFCQPLMIFWN